MKTLIKTLLILYNVIGSMSVSATDFNPLNYKGNENKYDVIVPKITEIVDKGSGIKVANCVHPVQQAQTYVNSALADLVFLDTSTNPETVTTENTGNKILVQQYGTITDYTTGNPDDNFQFDTNGLPIITKALKSDFLTPYLNTNGNEIFRQKINKSENASDVELQFSVNRPKFIMDGNKEKQVMYTEGGKNIPLVSYVKNENEVNIYYSVSILLQKAQIDNYTLAYDNDGIPIITKAITKSNNYYTDNFNPVFRQKSQIETLLKFDSNNNPDFEIARKQAKINSGEYFVYVTSEGYVTTEAISNGIANSPVYIQKNTGAASLSYSEDIIKFPKVKKALKSDNTTEYTEDGNNVFIQIDNNNSNLEFSNDDPVFETEKKQATTEDGTQLIFVDYSGNATKSSSNVAGPVYIQQHTGNLTYDVNGIPVIQQATLQDGETYYQENFQYVYIQSITTDGSLIYDEDNNPDFEIARKQAKINSGKYFVYVTSEGYVTTEAISNGIANSPVYIQKNTGAASLSYSEDIIKFPKVKKALKSDNTTEYTEDEKNIFIQIDNNNSTLEFSNDDPVFETEKKQATTKNGATRVFADSNGAITTIISYDTTPIYIQKISSTTNLVYDNNGIPLINKALKNDFKTAYTENSKIIYRQAFENEPIFEFDTSGNPVFITNADSTLKQATTESNRDVYVISEDKDFSSISISDQVAPILIQQWYPDGDDTYKSFVSDATGLKYDNNNLPVIKKVLNKDGTDYTIHGVQVYRQITIYEDNFKFYSDGNPIFLEDQHLATPFIMEGENIFTEVDNTVYEVGELVEIELVNDKKVIKQKCKTNNIPWYDLENYIIGYFTKNPTSINQGARLSQDTNFIVKNDYHFANGVSFLDAAGNSMKGTLFVPDGVTLFLDKSPDYLYNLNNAMPFHNSSAKNVYNVYYWNFLLFGRIVQYENSPSFSQFNQDYNCISVFAKYNDALDTNTGTIEKPKESIVDFFNGGFGYLSPIIYSNFIFNDNILTDNSYNTVTDSIPYSDSSRESATVKGISYHTLGTSGVLYLNRFINSDTDKAKKIKGTINYPMDIVFPDFIHEEDIKACTIGSQKFQYVEFFPNLLWYAENHTRDASNYVPMNYDEIQRLNKQAHFYFEKVYAKKIRLCDVQFIPDNNGRNVLNNVSVNNPFAEYDAVFYSGTIEPTIEEGEKPEYSGQPEYNPSENSNKYWDTSTVNNLFSNGTSYGTTGVKSNLPGELNVGLIDEDGTHHVSTISGLLKDGSKVQLNGDDQYYNGTYTVPSNTTQINLNNENAILKISKDGGGSLADLTYNAMVNTNWELTRTGDDVLSADGTKATLPMNIKNEQITSTPTYAIITFTDKNNTVNEIEFTGDNTGYNGYVILPETVTTVKFTNAVTTNDVNNAVLKILERVGRQYITTYDINNIIIKKYNEGGSSSNVQTIIQTIAGNTEEYTKQDNGTWIPTMPDNLTSALYYGTESSETQDNRDTLDEFKDIGIGESGNVYTYTARYPLNSSEYYFNTATISGVNQIDKCFKGTSYDDDTSGASSAMPPVINTGLINNGNITIENNLKDIDSKYKRVEFNGKNNGHASGNDIGKPYTGKVIIPTTQNIDTIQFGNNSFIANIVNESNEQYTNLNYFFEKDTVNNIKKFPVNGNNEFDNTKTADKLSLNLLTMDIGYYDSSNTTGNTTIENTNINVKTFKVRKGMTVRIKNGSHLSIKTPV